MKTKITLILVGLMAAFVLTSATNAKAETWMQKADMPTARWGFSASVVDGKIYAIGGVGAGASKKVEEYDPATDTWTEKADMPTGRVFLATSVVNGKIYAIGGLTFWVDGNSSGDTLATVEEYDPATDTWTQKADMPAPRGVPSTSVVNGRIYVIGGIAAVWEYDPATDTWTTKADMPTRRGFVSTSVFNGKIYAFGGQTPNGGPVLPTVEAYDPVTDTWTKKADMPFPRNTSTVVIDDKIYAFGGIAWRGGPPNSALTKYEPATDTWTWTTKDNMPVNLSGMGTSVVSGRIFFIGGTSSPYPYNPPLSTVWEYSLVEEGEPRYILDEITSPALEGNLLGDPATRPMWVWLPPSYDTSPQKRYPTIYMLHHFTGTHMSYKNHEFVDLDVGELAANLIAEGFMDEAILVLPDASNVYGGGFYSSNEVIGDYQTYITNDLVKYIDGKYRTIADRESRSIFGHSMGGYGALSLAIDYPEIFSAVAALGPANSDFEAQPTIIENFISEYPITVGEPLLAQTQDDLVAIVTTSFVANAVYANGAAFTPNPDNPPYYVDLPVQYPEKTLVPDLWEQWLENDLVSKIELNGANLTNTEIYFDNAVGEVVMMPELPGIELLPAALDAHGLAYTYVEAQGDHLSHLRERTTDALKFLSPPGTYILDEITSPSLEGNLLGDPATRPFWVWLPPSYDTSPEKRYPTIYLLHGFTGDHNQFKYGPGLNLNIGEMASNLIADGFIEEVIIVMPDASNVYGGSFYESNQVLGDYKGYIAQDMVNYVDETYRTIPDRLSRGIAGNSMGANGALTIALEYPEVFGAVAAMSPTSDLEVEPNDLYFVVEENPETLAEPTLVHNTEELNALLFIEFWVNILYAEAAAFSPNHDNPPYYVDLPLKYPEKTVVQDVWNKWLESDLVSQIEQNGQDLMNTKIYVDIGVGPVTFMPEVLGIELLLAALEQKGLEYTFAESPGDHLSHLRERTEEVLKFMVPAD